MDEIYLLVGFRSLSPIQQGLFLAYAEALRDRPETARLLAVTLFETLPRPDALGRDMLHLELFLQELLKSGEGNRDQCLVLDT